MEVATPTPHYVNFRNCSCGVDPGNALSGAAWSTRGDSSFGKLHTFERFFFSCRRAPMVRALGIARRSLLIHFHRPRLWRCCSFVQWHFEFGLVLFQKLTNSSFASSNRIHCPLIQSDRKTAQIVDTHGALHADSKFKYFLFHNLSCS